MVTKKSIMEAYKFLRENNNTVSDETLDFMKDASLRAFEKMKDRSVRSFMQGRNSK